MDRIYTKTKYGRLTILNTIRLNRRIYFSCQCECGSIKNIRKDAVVSGVTVSCGCYGREQRLKATKKHGMSKCSQTPHPLYGVWDSMIQRCTNSKSRGYKGYGGRGISVNKNWRNDFKSFYSWAISNDYSTGKQLDRIDNDKGYFPENCRWVTPAQNSKNRRNTINIEFNGTLMCLQDVANITEIPRATLYYRIKNNKPILQPLHSRQKELIC